MEELLKLLSKLAYRMPWEKWDLTEQEYTLLDNISGEKIVTTAYQHGFNIVKIIENADSLIDAHNDRCQRKILRDLQLLTRSVLAKEPQEKKSHPPPSPDPEQVERRILNETIEEVLGFPLDPTEPTQERARKDISEEDSWLDHDLQARMRQCQLIRKDFNDAPTTSFVDKFQNDFSSSPLLNRDNCQGSRSNIDLQDHIPKDWNQIDDNDSFPEATIDELSDMGMFATSFGRQLFDRVSGNKTPQVSFQGPIPGISVSDEEGTLMHTLVTTQRNLQSLVPLVDSRAVSIGMAASVETPVPELDIPQQVDQSYVSASDCKRREEKFEKLAVESVKQNKKQIKKNLKRKKQKKTTATPTLTELNKPLVCNKRKTVMRDFAPQIKFHLVNSELDYGMYQPDPVRGFADLTEDVRARNNDNEDQALLSEILGISDAVPLPSAQTSLMCPNRGTTSALKSSVNTADFTCPIITTLDHQVAELEAVETFAPEFPGLENAQAPIIVDTNVPITVLPSISFKPTITSTCQRRQHEAPKKAKTIDPQDLFFAELQRKSVAAEASAFENENLVSNGKEKTAPQASNRQNNEEYGDNGDHLFRRVKGKYDTMIEFVGADKKVKKGSQYSMETLALYLQIRCLMAERNTWKMPFTEIRPLVSLLNADAKTRIIRMRFMLLAEFKFLKLTLSDDENHIVDVEIPVLISNNLSEAFDA